MTESEAMEFGVVHAERNLQVCLQDQQAGVAVQNTCKIKGENNKCPAGSTMVYGGDEQSIDAYILCPLDAVAQSKWIEASQDGLCGCESQLYDSECSLIEKEMDCECFACPFGMQLGFAYSCTTEIVGPCKSFDCFGRCNEKYDPANLVGDKETFPPTIIEETPDSSSSNNMSSNHFAGTAIMALTLFRIIF